jgi:hypothetical protein
MVFGLERAGRRLDEIREAVDEEKELSLYVERRASEKKSHPLSQEIGALREYVEWLRYSREGSLIFSQPQEMKALPSEAPPFPGKTTLPVASVSEILRSPDRWAGASVIIEEGTAEKVSVNKRGEHWHILSDGTGSIAAVSGGLLEHSSGTLFGVARRTAAGGQLFIEVNNFYPSGQRDAPQEKRI